MNKNELNIVHRYFARYEPCSPSEVSILTGLPMEIVFKAAQELTKQAKLSRISSRSRGFATMYKQAASVIRYSAQNQRPRERQAPKPHPLLAAWLTPVTQPAN